MANRFSNAALPVVFCAAIVVVILAGPGWLQAVTVDSNTTIDGTNSTSPGEDIEVVDGLNPPTVLNIETGGHVQDLFARDSSRINMSGGGISGFMQMLDDSVLEFSGGNNSGHLYGSHRSTVTITGGIPAQEDVYAEDSSTVYMSGGRIFEALQSFDSGIAHLSGGTVDGFVITHDSSTIHMSGGSAVLLMLMDASTLNLSGGSIGSWMEVNGSSTLNVFGYDLAIQDDVLTGTLADDTPVNNEIRLSDNAQIILHEIPEPASALLALVGLAAVLGWRRRTR